ncbi:MAG: SpoIVB peptidase [bacterium]|nr:SpoIVB peptidase [bacterium]
MKNLTTAILIAAAIQTCAYAEDNDVYVIPSGRSVGVKLYTDGLTVAGVEKITGADGKSVSPAADAGIKKGDIIYSVNGVALSTVEQLAGEINKSPDSVRLEVRRGCESMSITADPAEASDNALKLGMWVRDSTAGIGTITYYQPENNTYAALGHGICDSDTGNILTVKSGNIQQCNDLTVKKSERGAPGELDAVFNGPELGVVELNSSAGIYGKMNSDEYVRGNPVKIAPDIEVHEGEAYIMTDAAGGGVEYYTVELQKLKPGSDDTKGIVFKVTDERLKEATGGVVKGMSGAPIIQEGKLVGAVTHVFVNDPMKGYGIFIENMLAQAEKLG